jgi:hypothetical protein
VPHQQGGTDTDYIEFAPLLTAGEGAVAEVSAEGPISDHLEATTVPVSSDCR